MTVEGWHTYHVGELDVWVHNECLEAVLRNYRPTIFNVDGADFVMRAKDLRHVLVRHHPDYVGEKHGTLFDPSITVKDLNSIIGQALRENRGNIPVGGQMRTTYQGVDYKVGTREYPTNGHGNIGQIFPVEDLLARRE